MFTSTLASQPLSEYKVKNQIYVLLWLFPCTYYGFAFKSYIMKTSPSYIMDSAKKSKWELFYLFQKTFFQVDINLLKSIKT